MFIDKARIIIKSGNGGAGCTSFYTEKYINNGGPDGGNGGNGGNVVFMADARLSSLIDFQYSMHFRAEDGERGNGRFCNGRTGKDIVVKVPLGTLIRDEESGGIIADMFHDGETCIVLKGGKGGKGNAWYKSARRQAPRFSQSGQKTIDRQIVLELKTIADVGLVGYPNVGKSTLLSVISAARPKIANYHFTTLSPNLGAVKYHGNSFVVADIPGLIDGASEGVGLGSDFLRHIERTRLIVHVIDISGSEGRDPVQDYKNINFELKNFSAELGKLPQIVALNKCEILADDSAIKAFKKKIKTPVVTISAATNKGIDELLGVVWNTLKELPPVKPIEYEPFEYVKIDATKFEIVRDTDGAFELCGGMIDELARGVILDNYDSFSFFQKKLREEGIIKALKANGAKDGDTVRVMDIEFEFVE